MVLLFCIALDSRHVLFGFNAEIACLPNLQFFKLICAHNTSISRRLHWFCVTELFAKTDQLELCKVAMAVGLDAFVSE
jgi:hypothetical protein